MQDAAAIIKGKGAVSRLSAFNAYVGVARDPADNKVVAVDKLQGSQCVAFPAHRKNIRW